MPGCLERRTHRRLQPGLPAVAGFFAGSGGWAASCSAGWRPSVQPDFLPLCHLHAQQPWRPLKLLGDPTFDAQVDLDCHIWRQKSLSEVRPVEAARIQSVLSVVETIVPYNS